MIGRDPGWDSSSTVAGADARACTRQAAWPAGSFAKHAGKVGRLTMRPDGDGDTKLEWADGSGTSGYVKVRELARATESDFRKVRPHCKGHDTTTRVFLHCSRAKT